MPSLRGVPDSGAGRAIFRGRSGSLAEVVWEHRLCRCDAQAGKAAFVG
jgi:hypothetical protein